MKHLLTATICTLLLGQAAQGSNSEPPLPPWQSMEFEQRYLWVVARARVSLAPAPDAEGLWRMQVDNSVASNSETLILDIDPGSGRSVTLTRLGKGRNQRSKEFSYRPGVVERTRRSPSDSISADPGDWPIRSHQTLTYPESCAEQFLGSVYSLLLLAPGVLEGKQAASYCVHSDRNFYQVLLSPVEGASNQVAMEVEPLAGNRDKDDFGLFGLAAPIVLEYQQDGLTLQRVHGRAPAVGETSLELLTATRREQGQ